MREEIVPPASARCRSLKWRRMPRRSSKSEGGQQVPRAYQGAPFSCDEEKGIATVSYLSRSFRALRFLSYAAGLLVLAGCAHHAPAILSTGSALSSQSSAPLPQAQGSYYRVQPGETLWRIAHDFGWDARALARINRLSSVTQLKKGQLLFIPVLPVQSSSFLWPARGRVAPIQNGANRQSLEISAGEGSFVRAARTGRVAVATRQLTGFGKTVILDHGDGYLTIYAGLEQLLVAPGMLVEQGAPLGRLARAPLYFQIRYGTQPRDPTSLLP